MVAPHHRLTDLQRLYGVGTGPVPQLWLCPGHTSLDTVLLWDVSILYSLSRPSQTPQSSPFCSRSVVRAELLSKKRAAQQGTGLLALPFAELTYCILQLH